MSNKYILKPVPELERQIKLFQCVGVTKLLAVTNVCQCKITTVQLAVGSTILTRGKPDTERRLDMCVFPVVF